MESFAQIVQAVKDYCKLHVNDAAYNLWLSVIEPVSFTGDVATISVNSEFIKNGVENRYLQLIREAFYNTVGFDVEVNITSREAEEQAKQQLAMTHMPKGLSKGEGDYTFQNFIIGSDNRFAQAAAYAVATNPSNAYNPLFIYGASGLGKTHLLFAIKNQLAVTHPHLNVLYIGGDSFTNDLIAAIRSGSTEAFHEKHRSVDVLLVDDVQFIGGRESTQEEFFHTFNALHQAHKQIVLTSDRQPNEIKSLEDRLRTRFEWGLIADVKPPDIETRISILYSKAESLGFSIPTPVIEFIAKQLKSDVRQLEGTVKKLYAMHLMDNSEPTIELAQSAIRDIVNEQMPWPATVDKIINEVARTYNVTPEDIRSSKQKAAISTARQVAMYIIREVTGNTMERIGSEFSNRNHATVVYAISKVESQMKTNQRLKDLVNDIIKNCQQ